MRTRIISVLCMFFCVDAHLNIATLIEHPEGIERRLAQTQPGAMLTQLMACINQNILCIVSKNLLYSLKLASAHNQSAHSAYRIVCNRSQWLSFIIDRHFMLLVPIAQSSSIITLHLQPCDTYHLSDCSEPIDIPELELFLGMQQTPMRMYLSGHGSRGKNHDEPVIAQCTISQYRNLLEILHNSKCTFLYVTSCFSGGSIPAHEGSFDFDILLSGIPDCIIYIRQEMNLEALFQAIETYTTDGNATYLQQAIGSIEGHHVPCSIIKHAKCIHFEAIITPEIRYIYHHEPAIECVSERALVICSTEIQQLITIHSTSAPAIISGIPGCVTHFLNTVEAKKCSFNDFFASFLQVHTNQQKMFFIRQLELYHMLLKNVIIEPSPLNELIDSNEHPIVCVSYTVDNTRYAIEISEPTINLAHPELMHEEILEPIANDIA